MITKISFDNFKCLDNKSFNLKNITLFTGYNGRGKSSVIQFILMLSQSINKDKNGIRKLHLNGELISLGDYDEILTNDKNVDLGVSFDLYDTQCKNIKLTYTLSTDDIKIASIKECYINGEDYFDTVGKKEIDYNNSGNKVFTKALPQDFINLFSNIHFISANRQGPVEYVKKQEVPEFHNVGTNGCFTINTISTYKDRISPEMNVNIHDSNTYSLKEAVSYWMDYIMNGGGIQINGDKQGEKSSVLSLGVIFNERPFQAYNVGFGYSYILSIIVTALIAKHDSIVIIENPEAHLHPEAQLKITELLSKLSSRGIQVIIETHSEHIINGFRINALQDDFKLKNDELSIYFFDQDFTIKELILNPNGRIPNWPNGFFDQFENEMIKIISLGAKVK